MRDKSPDLRGACRPKDWRRIDVLTGDYDFDATIAHCKDGSVLAKVKQRISTYGPVTAYDGYSNYGGDD